MLKGRLACAALGESPGHDKLGLEARRQVSPMRIDAFDQVQFAAAGEFFEPRFAVDCLVNVGEGFIPDKNFDAILPGEAGDDSGAVLMGAARQVVGHTDIECAVALARKEIDVIRFLHCVPFMERQ